MEFRLKTLEEMEAAGFLVYRPQPNILSVWSKCGWTWVDFEAPEELTVKYQVLVGNEWVLEPLDPPEKLTPKTCDCDIHLLMRSGCACGGFEAEMKAKRERERTDEEA
jgi:hypothetical protein